MVAKVQIKRTSTPNSPPADLSLSPGELAVEMAVPTRLWVGVPSNLDATGKKLLNAGGVEVADAPSAGPAQGHLWYESDTGILWMNYQDVDSSQWVQVNGTGGSSGGGAVDAYTKAESDARFVDVTGDLMNGALNIGVMPGANALLVTGSSVLTGNTKVTGTFEVDGLAHFLGNTACDASLTVANSGAPTQGTIFFGQSAASTLSFDGAQFEFAGGTSGGGVIAGSFTARTAAAPAEGVVYFGAGGANSIGFNGTLGTWGWAGGAPINCYGDFNIVKPDPTLFLYKTITTGGHVNQILGGSINMPRWAIHLGNADVETNNNDGSHFALYAFNDSAAAWPLLMGNRTTTMFSCMTNAEKPGGGDWVVTSDARIKNVIGPYAHGLAELKQINPIRYTYKSNVSTYAAAAAQPDHKMAEGREFVGIVAQQVEGILPETVTQVQGWIDGQKVTDLRQYDSSALVYALINAVKELSVQVEALKAHTGMPELTPTRAGGR